MATSSIRFNFWCLILKGLLCFCAAGSFFSDEDLLGLNFSDEQVEMLEKLTMDYISSLKDDVTEQTSQPVIKRTKRDTVRASNVTGMTSIPDLHANSTVVNNTTNINCFLWNESRYCIIGDRIFIIQNRRLKLFLNELPVQPEDEVKAYVYQDAVFFAIYNNTSSTKSTLRLYLLLRNTTSLVNVQEISGYQLQDCTFFESYGYFYMALAIQLGPKQYVKDVGMQCVIYEWTGTVMDILHTIAIPDLEQITPLYVDESTPTYLLLLSHGNTRLQLWKIRYTVREAELLQILQVDLPIVLQVENFRLKDDWCVLFGGTVNSHLYCILKSQGFKLSLQQVLAHNQTSSPISWSSIQTHDRQSVILTFNAFDDLDQYEFYHSNSSGLLEITSQSEEFHLSCSPRASTTFLDGIDEGILLRTCSNNETYMEGFAIQLSQLNVEEPRPYNLHRCLSDVEDGIKRLVSIDDVESLKSNMVHVDDNFICNGTVTTARLEYEQASLDSVKVLFNYTDVIESPIRVNDSINELLNLAIDLAADLPNLLHTGRSPTHFQGDLTLRSVSVEMGQLESISVGTINGWNWTEMADESWRYSVDQEISGDIDIGSVTATEVVILTEAAGTVTPSQWLQKSGGVLSGRVSLADVSIQGDLDITHHFINDVDLRHVLTRINHDVGGVKTLQKLVVHEDILANSFNGRSFEEWYDTLALRNDAIKFSGHVNVIGPVQVDEGFHCESINGLNASRFPEMCINKHSPQLINGRLRYTGDLLINNAHLKTLNGIAVDDFLYVSGFQEVGANFNVDTIEVIGNVTCADIEKVDFNDLFFIDDSDTTSLRQPLLFANDVSIHHLLVKDGKLNDFNIERLLDPRTLRIDSKVIVDGNVTVHSMEATVINGLDITNLESKYWTKSTEQVIDVGVTWPTAVKVTGNITTKTFQNRSLPQDFYLTSTDEKISSDVVFNDVMTVEGHLTVDNLETIGGVDLHALDNDVVKKEGHFHIAGTKTFQNLRIHGNVRIEQTLNGLHIPDDIVLLNRSQRLQNADFGTVVSVENDVTSLNGDITVNTISDIVLDDFVASVVMVDDENVDIDGHIYFEQQVLIENLFVENLLNDNNIQNIVSNGLWKNGSTAQRLEKLVVLGDVTFQDSVGVDLINTNAVQSFFADVVNITRPQRVTGVKRSKSINVTDDAVVHLFNDRILDFSTILTASGNQTITGRYSLNNLTARAMDVVSINGQSLSDLVEIGGGETQIITGEVNIDQMNVARSLRVESQTLNDCQLTNYLEVEEFRHFDTIVIENGTLHLEQPIQNNFNLSSLVLRSVRKDRAQVIEGNVTLDADSEMKNVDVPNDDFTGIDLHELFNKAMLKSTDQNISGALTFTSHVEVEHFEGIRTAHIGHWNDQNTTEMLDELVLNTGVQYVSSRKNIHGALNIKQHLNVSEILDDVPVEYLVPVTSNRLPNGTEFTRLKIANELNVGGLIDGVNFTEMLDQRIPVRGDCIITGNMVFTGDLNAGNVTVGKINDVLIDDLVLRSSSPRQMIKGTKFVRNSVDFQGDVLLSRLNGRIPEEVAAHVVAKDQDAELEGQVTFGNNLQVRKGVRTRSYNQKNMAEIINRLSNFSTRDANSSISLTSKLQTYQDRHFSDFEFFEQIQAVPLNLPSGSNVSVQIHHYHLPMKRSSGNTATGVLIATQSSDGSSCNRSEACRCHHCVLLPLDASGRAKALRMPIRLAHLLRKKQLNGERIRLLHTRNWLFVVGVEVAADECSREKLYFAGLDPVTFEIRKEVSLEFSEVISDMAVEQDAQGTVYLVMSQPTWGVLIYSFNGDYLRFHQRLKTKKAVAIDMVLSEDGTGGKSMFLAVASQGIETTSTAWKMETNGKFELLNQVTTVGAADVLFTKSNETLYLTFAQDPSNVDQFSGDWSLYSVPALVLLYTPLNNNFDKFQLLDIERVVSLTNLEIGGVPFMAVATSTEEVRIYRLISGQGFRAEQSFHASGVRSITSYSIQRETYLSVTSKWKSHIFVARVRGLRKPYLTKG